MAANARFYLQRVLQFSGLLLHRFAKDRGTQHTAALTYTSLLSLVPLMTVMLALFSAFPASEQLAAEIEGFVFDNFVPAAGAVVHEHLRNFSQKAARLSGVGFVFLLLVALLLMANIDKAFNDIWHVRRKRSPLATFTVYWAILTLGPILIVASVGVTSYLVSMPLFTDGETVLQVRTRLLGTMPVLISALAFTLLYALVPNRTVPLRHALTGGVLAAMLFEVAKRGFALYVTHFPTYEAIYGAMAVVPIFLIWVYLSWLVTLLGAEFTYCLGIFRDDWHISQQQGEVTFCCRSGCCGISGKRSGKGSDSAPSNWRIGSRYSPKNSWMRCSCIAAGQAGAAHRREILGAGQGSARGQTGGSLSGGAFCVAGLQSGIGTGVTSIGRAVG